MASESTKWSNPNSAPSLLTCVPTSSCAHRDPLPAEFYLQPTETVARELLGKALVRIVENTVLVAEIVEVEAYLGHQDPASHAYGGKTKRNQSMFDTGGSCYVYLSYGIHYCMNVSTGPQHVGEAVLLRAVAPVEGEPHMQQNRNRHGATRFDISNGPGKLTQAFGIDLSFDGRRFDGSDFKLVDFRPGLRDKDIVRSPRIGISKAKESLLRFYVKASPWLSR